MPHTPHRAEQVCTHERGVGTTLCLHCRHEARLAARIKRQRLMLRGTAAAIVVATFVSASAIGATAMRSRNATRRADSAAAPAVAVRPAATSPVKPAPQPQPVDSAAKAPAPRPSLVSILPAGESALSDGVKASRADDVVTVSFDIPMVRTRIPDKFERFVRSTLPQIYGAAIDSSLSRLPVGTLVGQGDLLTVLPAHGMRIPAGADWEVRVLPVIRPGLDGPIVVKYRTMVCAATEEECSVR